MRTLRGQFILSHILPLLLVTPLVAAGLIYTLETQVLLKGLSEQLSQQAALIVEALRENSEVWVDPGEAGVLVARVNLLVDGQVYLFEPDGDVLAIAPGQGDQVVMPNNLERPGPGETTVALTYGLFQQRADVLVPVTDASNRVLGFVGVSRVLEGAATQFAGLRRFVGFLLLAELVLGGLVGLFLARQLARPIARAAGGVVALAEGRNEEPLPLEGPREIRELEQAVNTLHQRLRQLEEARRRSLANIVHELGRPLGAIRSAVHVLLHGAADDRAIREELLTGVEAQVERMEPLLDDLAQLHGQVTGQLQLQREAVDLGQWLPSMLLPWRAAALDKGLQWETTIPDSLPAVAIDPGRMAQVLGNLLSNAVKYTPTGGKVSVVAGANQENAWIGVSDTGPGILLEEQELVFQAFYRSQSERRFPQGLGLGLTIAKDLVEAHDGRLTLDSVPGKGSTFRVELPVSGS